MNTVLNFMSISPTTQIKINTQLQKLIVFPHKQTIEVLKQIISTIASKT